MNAMNICYHYQNGLYVNITNQCTNRCDFCIRFTPSGVDGVNLWLEHEPTIDEVTAALSAAHFTDFCEIIFCGYGEPMLRPDLIIAASKFIKAADPTIKIRINTNGHGNRAAGRDITPELDGLIDVISISLNAENAEEYEKICHSNFGKEGFYEMLDFAKKAKEHIPTVVLSVVDIIGKEKIEACRKVADSVGVSFRVRQYSE